MITIVLAVLVFILFHQANEGATRFRWPGQPVLAAVQVGRVQVVVRRYRPHRVYFRLSYAPAMGGIR